MQEKAAGTSEPERPVSFVARATGLEPATSGSTVRNSNQLSYAPTGPTANHMATERHRPEGKRTADTSRIFPRPALLSSQNVPGSKGGGTTPQAYRW